MTSAIILAAGLSSRMNGSNKLLLPYRDESIVRGVVSRIVDASPGEVIVVLGYDGAAIETSLQDLPVTFCRNENYASGLTSSIITGVASANGDGYMVCLSDMYAITTPEYRAMLNVFENRFPENDRCICIPRYNGQHGNPVIFSKAYRELILLHDEPNGCRGIVTENAQNVVWMDMPFPHILQDIDFPQDYASLEEMN